MDLNLNGKTHDNNMVMYTNKSGLFVIIIWYFQHEVSRFCVSSIDVIDPQVRFLDS